MKGKWFPNTKNNNLESLTFDFMWLESLKDKLYQSKNEL